MKNKKTAFALFMFNTLAMFGLLYDTTYGLEKYAEILMIFTIIGAFIITPIAIIKLLKK